MYACTVHRYAQLWNGKEPSGTQDAQSSRREASISAGDGKLLPEDAWAAGIGVENPSFTSHCPWNCGFLYVYIYIYIYLSLYIYIYIYIYVRIYIYIHASFLSVWYVCVFKERERERERESYADVGSIPRYNVSMHAHTFPCTHHHTHKHKHTHTHTLHGYISYSAPFFRKSWNPVCGSASPQLHVRRCPAPKRPYVHFWLAPQAIFLGAVMEMHSQWGLVLY